MSLDPVAMQHVRFWTNYGSDISNVTSAEAPGVWCQLMHDVQLNEHCASPCLTTPLPQALPQSLAALTGHQGPVKAALALADGSGFLSWSDDDTLRLWGPDGAMRALWLSPESFPSFVEPYSQPGIFIVGFGKHVGLVRMWETSD